MTKQVAYKQKTKVWLYPGETAAWHFAILDKKLSQRLRKEYKAFTRGFGSLPVEVTTGKTTWETSIFYDSKAETYMLPLKADVRRKEQIRDGDSIIVTFTIRS